MQGASEQCMHATDIERSPGTPSLMVTTRRRFTPQGTSCSFLHAVTQPLHSMQRSASHRNFIRAILVSSRSLCSVPVSGRQLQGNTSTHIVPRHAFATWHSEVLVSCIMVTIS